MKMIKYQYLRQDNLALTIATVLDRENGNAYYGYSMKHPKDKFVKKQAIEALKYGYYISVYDCLDGSIEIDDSLTRNELLLAILCDIYVKHRLTMPKHYRIYVMQLIDEFNIRLLMGY